jgi:hypothetical protein
MIVATNGMLFHSKPLTQLWMSRFKSSLAPAALHSARLEPTMNEEKQSSFTGMETQEN